MNRIVLAGCRNEPLGAYLQGLGLWRAVVRLLDPAARAHWDGGRLVLTTEFDLDGLLDALLARFSPIPVVSPWNAGSGFADNGNSVKAERALAEVMASTDTRLDQLREVIGQAKLIVAEGRRRGWGGTKNELWDKARKPDVVQLCRNRLPDDALPWIDTAVILGQDDDPTYSRLLGTGGNFGRQDLSATYLQRLLTVLDGKQAVRSRRWLRAVLTGDESVPYLREAVGQFDPGRAGGIQSSPWEQDDNGFANPWSFLLAIEGTVLFASAVVRRQGALMSNAAVPFMVQASAAGFAGSAPDETVHGEVWTPEWNRPAQLPEVEHLLGEGRADWNGRTARSGLDFARAISSLAVDRGITHFVRHVFVERHGQNPLAIPVARVAVVERGSVGLLADLDPWLDRLRRVAMPTTVEAGLRQVDSAIYTMTQVEEASGLRDVLAAVGRLHQAVERSGGARERTGRPLVLRRPAQWWAALRPDFAELRVAGALASATDPPSQQPSPVSSLRLLLSPVQFNGRALSWSNEPSPVSSRHLVAGLAAAHRRRAFPGQVSDPADGPDKPSPAVRGVITAFGGGMTVSLADATHYVTGRFDDDLLEDYLRGLMLFSWSADDVRQAREPTAGEHPEESPVIPPAFAILVPFFAVQPLRIPSDDGAGGSMQVVLRPGAQWISQLCAGGTARVVGDAVRRLRAAGVTHTVTEASGARSQVAGERLAAALLLPLTPGSRVRALTRVATLPGQPRQIHPVPSIEGALS